MGYPKYAEDITKAIENNRAVEAQYAIYYESIRATQKQERKQMKIIKMPQKDIVMRCMDCGKVFKYTVKDQEYFLAKGWTAPKRCKECRKARREIK